MITDVEGRKNELRVEDGDLVVAETALEPFPEAASFDARAVVSVVSRGTELRVADGATPFASGDFDFAARRFVRSPPITHHALGYQWVGEVVRTCDGGPALGSLVTAFASHGDRHRIAVDDRWSTVPAGLPPTEGALLVSAQVALKSVHDAGLVPGEEVVVVGAGVIGLMVTRILLRHGFGVTVLGTRSIGLGVAREAGAAVVEVTRGALADDRMPTDVGPGVDVVIDTSGAPEVLDGALGLLRPHGRLVVTSFHGSLPVPLSLGAEFHHNALEVVSSQFDWGCGTGSRRWDIQRLQRAAQRLLEAGIGRGLITHELDFATPEASYRVVREHPGIGYAFTYERGQST